MRDAWATSDNQAVAFVHFLEQLSDEEAKALRAALEICPPSPHQFPGEEGREGEEGEEQVR